MPTKIIYLPMQHKHFFRTAILVTALAALALGSFTCKHDPFLSDDDLQPGEGTEGPSDPNGQGEPCDPEVVYFEAQVLPILKSNCALSGCHDAQSAEEGIVLESYESLMRSDIVDAGSLDESDLYEVLVEDEGDERMPPPPAEPLDPELIERIADWIQQGAKDLSCEPGTCETTEVSFAQTVQPVLKVHCVGCHSGNTPSGGISLNTHAGVKAVADNGRLIGSITWASGFKRMPEGGAQLPDCDISQIQAWIDDGAQNN